MTPDLASPDFDPEAYINATLAIELTKAIRAHPDYQKQIDEDEQRILYGDSEAKDAPMSILSNQR